VAGRQTMASQAGLGGAELYGPAPTAEEAGRSCPSSNDLEQAA